MSHWSHWSPQSHSGLLDFRMDGLWLQWARVVVVIRIPAGGVQKTDKKFFWRNKANDLVENKEMT